MMAVSIAKVRLSIETSRSHSVDLRPLKHDEQINNHHRHHLLHHRHHRHNHHRHHHHHHRHLHNRHLHNRHLHELYAQLLWLALQFKSRTKRNLLKWQSERVECFLSRLQSDPEPCEHVVDDSQINSLSATVGCGLASTPCSHPIAVRFLWS